jgi:hypothetical protein
VASASIPIGLIDQHAVEHRRNRLERDVSHHGAQPRRPEHRPRAGGGRPMAGHVADQQRQRSVRALGHADEITAQQHRVDAGPVAPGQVPAVVYSHSRHQYLLELAEQLL